MQDLFLLVPAKKNSRYKTIDSLFIEQLISADNDSPFYEKLSRKGFHALGEFVDYFFALPNSSHIISPNEIGAILSAQYILQISQNYGCKATYEINNHISTPFGTPWKMYDNDLILELIYFINAQSNKTSHLIAFSSSDTITKLVTYYLKQWGKDVSFPFFNQGEGIHLNLKQNRYILLQDNNNSKKKKKINWYDDKQSVQRMRDKMRVERNYFVLIEQRFFKEPLYIVDSKANDIGRIKNMRPYGDAVDTNEILIDFIKTSSNIESKIIYLSLPDDQMYEVKAKNDLTSAERNLLQKVNLLD